MGRLALVAAISLVSVTAFAEKVAVIEAAFVYSDSEEESVEASKKLTGQAEEGVKDAECELIPQIDVRRAIVAIGGAEKGGCRDVECLARLADYLAADEVVFVKVTEFGEIDREIEIFLSRGNPVREKSGDGFMVMLQEVRRLVALRLRKSLAQPAEETEAASPPPQKEPKVPADGSVEGGQADPSPPSFSRDLRGFGPMPFYIFSGIAIAGGIAWGALDGAVYARFKKLDEGKEDRNYWNTTRSLQVADWTMMGVTGVAAITALTLFFLTDFKRRPGNESVARRSFWFSPAALERGGMVVIDSRF